MNSSPAAYPTAAAVEPKFPPLEEYSQGNYIPDYYAAAAAAAAANNVQQSMVGGGGGGQGQAHLNHGHHLGHHPHHPGAAPHPHHPHHPHLSHPHANPHHPYGYHHLNYIDQNSLSQAPPPPSHPQAYGHGVGVGQHSSPHHVGGGAGGGGNGPGGPHQGMSAAAAAAQNALASATNNGLASLQQQHQSYFSSCSMSPLGLTSANGSLGQAGVGLGGVNVGGVVGGPHPGLHHSLSSVSNQISPHHQLSPIASNPMQQQQQQQQPQHLSSRVSSPLLPRTPSPHHGSLDLGDSPLSPQDCGMSTHSGSDSGTGNAGGHPVIYPWMKKVHINQGKGGGGGKLYSLLQQLIHNFASSIDAGR